MSGTQLPAAVARHINEALEGRRQTLGRDLTVAEADRIRASIGRLHGIITESAPITEFDRNVAKLLNEAVPLAQRVVGRELTAAERFAVVRRVREALGEAAPRANESAPPTRKKIPVPIAETTPRSDYLREELGRLSEVGRRILGRPLTTEEKLDLVAAIDTTTGATPPAAPDAATLASMSSESFRDHLDTLPDAQRPYGRARESAPADIPRPGAGAPLYEWDEYRRAVMADAVDRSNVGPRRRR